MRGMKVYWYLQLLQEVYCKFFSIAKPLIRLSKKFTKFEWRKECQTAFDFLKENLTTVPVLAYPDTSKLYILYTDVSDDCMGACLCQEQDTQGEMKSNKPNEKAVHIESQTYSFTDKLAYN